MAKRDHRTDRTDRAPEKTRASETPEKPRWEEDFLRALGEKGTVEEACHAARIGRRTAYSRREKYPGFAAQWKLARERFGDRLQAEIRRRGVEGVPKPVFHQGKKCGEVTEYSDTLLIFMTKAVLPEIYREETLTMAKVVQMFDRMIEILRTEAGDTYAGRVTDRLRREVLGGAGNGNGKAPSVIAGDGSERDAGDV